MSSPAGLQQSQTNFLAQWMPSSSRAGVILNPSPDLAESLRYSSTWDSRDMEDSFTSHFAPLPASRSSSCLSVHAIDSEQSVTDFNHLNHRPRERILSDQQASGPHGASLRLAGETESMDEMINQSQELPLTLKLDQLRLWQKHMQEELKAQQLEELLHLQEEQQRLLGLAQGGREGPDCTGSPSLTEADWGESTLQTEESPGPKSPPLKGPLAPANWRQENSLQGAPQDQKQVGPEGWQDTLGTHAWNYRDQQQSVDESCEEQDVTGHTASSMSEDLSVCEADPENRPIKPGIGGHKRTFEELLEEQLRLEDQKLRASELEQSPESTEGMRANPKRAFLKRGEGLSRFTNQNKATVPNRGSKKQPKPQPQVKTNVPRSSESRNLQKAAVNQRPPVQRKTAVLNKENRPRIPLSTPQEPRGPQPAAARVLGAHQRQNTGPPDTAQPPPTRRLSQRVPLKEASNIKLMQSSQPATVNKPSGPLPQLVTKQVGLREGPGTLDKGTVSSARDTAEENPALVRIPEDSFELSFQEKLRRWDCERQTESVELGEFELLEQAAEELSFSSNSSFVTKVLQLDRQQHRHLQSSRGGLPRRLSSTPIKSPRPSPPKGPEGGEGERRSFGCGAPAETGEDLLRSAARAGDDHDDEEEDDDEDAESKPEASDISLTSSSEFGDEVVAGSSHVPTFPSSLCFSTSNPPYDKRSYQDQGRVESSGQGGEGEGDDHSMVSSDPDNSTLLEDKEDHQGHLVFDDDDTWNDLEETGGAHAEGLVPAATVNDLTSPERMLTRKVAMVKGMVPDRGGAMGTANQEPDLPPTSQLMTRLFPTLKPKAHPAPPPPVVARPTEQGAGQQGQQSRQLRERLVELELEIERFRKENTALAKLRQENEQSQESLRKERAEFEQRKAEELARFEEFRKEETRRLQKERQVFEKHASAARAIPDKKERQEIQSLKQQLSSLQEELKRRESRWSTTHSRLRQQVEALATDNGALREEVRTLERLRLSTWKSSHADADKDRKDKPGFFESSGTKTVKFASPPESMRSSPPQISHTTKGSPGDSSLPSAGGIRSSLKRSSPAPSPEVLAGQVGSPGAGSRSQDQTLNQEHSLNLSPRAGDQQTEETSKVEEQQPSQEVLTHPDGKTERLLPCGGKLILFPNGTRKEVSADGQTAKVTFFNGDIKQVLGDQRVVYYYAEAQTTHTTYPDGMEVLQFPNNQTEKHFSDGRKEITFPDQTIKNLFPDGKEESVLTDGTVVQVNPDGTKVIQFITGQKEIHTAEYKRREYPDGTVKTVFTDGRQETRYPTGRVRAKDKDGNVVMDK